MKLSLIIPVYNVEDYIASCLDSIIAQDLMPEAYEIIVINDGSSDHSKSIIEQYEKKHPLIFIDQENQGVSVARNRGLDIAKGDYIAFIDPDDSIHSHSLKPILDRAYDEDVDVMYLGFELYDEQQRYIRQVEPNGKDHIVLSGFEHPRRTYPATLYKRSLIGDIRFTKGIIRGQDTVFNIMVHAMAQRCTYYSGPYYKYLQRDTSSRQFVGTEKNFISMLLAIQTINDFSISKFPKATALQNKYFDDAMLLFISRIFEWNILPQANKSTYLRLKANLKEMGLGYLITQSRTRFPHFDKSFAIFMAYQRMTGYYNAIIHKLKKG